MIGPGEDLFQDDVNVTYVSGDCGAVCGVWMRYAGKSNGCMRCDHSVHNYMANVVLWVDGQFVPTRKSLTVQRGIFSPPDN